MEPFILLGRNKSLSRSLLLQHCKRQNCTRLITRDVYFIRFSTKDHGNVETAKTHEGAWWYGSTVVSNLNGQYFDSEVNRDESIFWKSLNNKKGLKSTKLMIREGMPGKI